MTEQVTAPLARGLSLIEAMRLEARPGSVELDGDLNSLTVSAGIRELSGELRAQLLSAATDGHSAQIVLELESWSATIIADGPARPTITVSGVATDALNEADVRPFQTAVDNADADAALSIANYVPARLTLIIRNDAAISGFHWVNSTSMLMDLLTGPRWPLTISTLAAAPVPVLVSDAGSSTVTTAAVVLKGPSATGVPTPSPQSFAPPPAHRQPRPALPSPELLKGAQYQGPAGSGMSEIVDVLHGIARNLTWFHLASEAALGDGGVMTLRFDGARTLTLTLAPGAESSPEDDIALYRWAASGSDPARLDSVVHAATLAILTTADLGTAAAPVLRTAKSLYELSRQGAVAEALATRRAAREAALTSARTAADTARQVAGKATERSLLQVGAAVAVVLSNAANIIGRVPAAALLLLVAAFATMSMTVALRLDLPAGKKFLADELADLDQYRDSLSTSDIDEVRNLAAVRLAKDQLDRARKAAAGVYGVTIAAVLIAGGALVLSHHPRSPSGVAPSVSPPSSASAPSTPPATSHKPTPQSVVSPSKSPHGG